MNQAFTALSLSSSGFQGFLLWLRSQAGRPQTSTRGNLLSLCLDSDKGIFKLLEIKVAASQCYFHPKINQGCPLFSGTGRLVLTDRARGIYSQRGLITKLLEPAGLEHPFRGRDVTQIFPLLGQLLLMYLPGVTLRQGLLPGPSH